MDPLEMEDQLQTTESKTMMEDNQDEDNVKENVGTLGQRFGQSFVALEKVSKLLTCVKCGKVPGGKDKVYTPGQCVHKYCSICVETFSERAQPCEVCDVVCLPGKAVEDIFSSSLVAGLDRLKIEINKSTQKKNNVSVTSSNPLTEVVAKNQVIVPPVPAKRSAVPSTVAESTAATNPTESTIESVVTYKPVPAKRNKSRCITPDLLDLDDNIGEHTPVASTPLPVTRGRPKFTPSSIESAGSKSTPTSASTPVDLPMSRSSRRSKSNSIGSAEIKSITTTPTPDRTMSRNSRNRSNASSTGVESPTVAGNTSVLSNSGKGEKKNAKGETQLHISCRKGELEKVQQLILDGADTNVQDHAGWTPLHEAINGKGAQNCKLNLVKVLCEDGSCNPNIPGMDNESALHEAARGGLQDIVTYLLAHGASPNIRNRLGQLPCDVAASQEILQALKHTTSTPTGDADESLIVDPVVLEIQLSNAIVYFTYELSSDDRCKVEQDLNLKVSKNLGTDVTHMVFQNDKPEKTVPFSYQYLHGIAIGAWMLSSEWINKSIEANKVLSPCKFELNGCDEMADPDGSAPKSSRLNKDLGNPKLFHGFCFYFYKNSSYNNPFENITKKNLIKLGKLADGAILNREPQPATIEPLENPERFHLKQKENHKLAFTSHIILYDDKNCPPPSKMHNMEHIKALKIQWFIDSLVNFTLKDPDGYL